MENREARNNKIFKENPDMKFVVRLYDGFNNGWIDVSVPLSLSDARTEWLKETENGTIKTRYSDINCCDIFPENIKMVYSLNKTIIGSTTSEPKDKVPNQNLFLVTDDETNAIDILDLQKENKILHRRIKELEAELKKQLLYP